MRLQLLGNPAAGIGVGVVADAVEQEQIAHDDEGDLLGEATGVMLETRCRGAFGGSVVVHGVVAFHTFTQSGEAFG